jgi:hypothetical protein
MNTGDVGMVERCDNKLRFQELQGKYHFSNEKSLPESLLKTLKVIIKVIM